MTNVYESSLELDKLFAKDNLDNQMHTFFPKSIFTRISVLTLASFGNTKDPYCHLLLDIAMVKLEPQKLKIASNFYLIE